jgi:hypothetical protein
MLLQNGIVKTTVNCQMEFVLLIDERVHVEIEGRIAGVFWGATGQPSASLVELGTMISVNRTSVLREIILSASSVCQNAGKWTPGNSLSINGCLSCILRHASARLKENW